MQLLSYPAPKDWPHLLARPTSSLQDIESRVMPIIEKVKTGGDKALCDFTQQFDGVAIKPNQLAVTPAEIQQAAKNLDPTLKKAIEKAAYHIKKFHAAQHEPVQKIETASGVLCWRKSVGIQKVGLYVPGGTAPLFSSVLMLGIPAVLAGCEQIILCTPPAQDGSVHPAILFAAQMAGITQIYKAGGSQAIAAMAYGTETIPAVYKIFGPGNQYVTAAKQIVSREHVAIDMPAGPSEVLVYGDAGANADFVAADLLSQAEHGSDSQVILVLTKEAEHRVKSIQEAIDKLLNKLPRKEMAKQSLANSKIVLVKNEAEAIELINVYAPEHLILCLDNPQAVAAQIINAGSVFMGYYTPESAGDYASGTNHTLPTNGYAKVYSGVSLDSFVKKITFQQITPAGIQALGPVVETMAAAEQLTAHKEAVSVRLAYLKNG